MFSLLLFGFGFLFLVGAIVFMAAYRRRSKMLDKPDDPVSAHRFDDEGEPGV